MAYHASSPSRTARGLTACLLLVLIACVCGPSRALAEDEQTPDPRGLEARVNDAIDAGVRWLRAQQRDNGSFPLTLSDLDAHLGDPNATWAGGPWHKGLDALCVYTLAVCGVEMDDPALEKGFANLRRHWAGRQVSRAGGPETHDGISTYFVSLCLLALDAAHNRGALPLGKGPPDRRRSGKKLLGKTDFAWAKELVDWLEAAQDEGTSGRSSKRPPTPEDGGGFGYTSPAVLGSHVDHSNSQFAVLGLKSAARLGVKVPDVVFVRALRHFLAVQEAEGPLVDRVDAPDAADEKAGLAPGERRTTDEGAPAQDVARGWGYMCPSAGAAPPIVRGGGPEGLPPGLLPPGGLPGLPPDAMPELMGSPTASMTAGGISTLVICRSELEGVRGFTRRLRQLTVKGIRDGLAWLALRLEKEGKRTDGPPAGLPPGLLPEDLDIGGMEAGRLLDDFYFLYGLERACILGGVGTVGGIAWYSVGAERIVDRQRKDGSFLSKSRDNGNGRPAIDSCFALLFLKRAIFRVPDRRVITPSD